MISGRAVLLILVLAVVVAVISYGAYYLLLPKFKKWYGKFNKGYEKYEKKEEIKK